MMHDALLIALICGLCCLDATAVFQLMFSRPLVVGTLCGLALHEPQAGFASACVIELLWLGNLPVGSVVPPDFTLAAGLASGVSILLHRSFGGQLSWEACQVWMLLFVLPVAWIGGWSDLWQRRKSAALASWVELRLNLGDESALAKAMALSLGVGFARSFLLALAGMLLLPPAFGWMLGMMPVTVLRALDWMYWLSLLLGFMVLLDLFWERRWLKVLGFSFVASAVAAYGLRLPGQQVLGVAAALGVILAVVNELRLRRGSAGGS
jgi:mannose/fructose/N-acetylgalactosamine-specific phosphotransferase system component IIC